jgi:hypothetical protein
LRIKNFGMGLLVAAGSLVLASAAFAGVSTLRLNGDFSFEEQSTDDINTGCVRANFTTFEVFGDVTGTSGDCTVTISYDGFVPNKAQASVLKDDNSGTAKISQQVETFLAVSISGPVTCTDAPFSGVTQPEKCKVSSSVNATEGAPDTVQKAKASLSCELGSDGSELVPSPTTAQVDTIIAAFADRKDVKVDNKGKVTIKTKGEADDGDGCD